MLRKGSDPKTKLTNARAAFYKKLNKKADEISSHDIFQLQNEDEVTKYYDLIEMQLSLEEKDNKIVIPEYFTTYDIKFYLEFYFMCVFKRSSVQHQDRFLKLCENERIKEMLLTDSSFITIFSNDIYLNTMYMKFFYPSAKRLDENVQESESKSKWTTQQLLEGKKIEIKDDVINIDLSSEGIVRWLEYLIRNKQFDFLKSKNLMIKTGYLSKDLLVRFMELTKYFSISSVEFITGDNQITKKNYKDIIEAVINNNITTYYSFGSDNNFISKIDNHVSNNIRSKNKDNLVLLYPISDKNKNLARKILYEDLIKINCEFFDFRPLQNKNVQDLIEKMLNHYSYDDLLNQLSRHLIENEENELFNGIDEQVNNFRKIPINEKLIKNIEIMRRTRFEKFYNNAVLHPLVFIEDTSPGDTPDLKVLKEKSKEKNLPLIVKHKEKIYIFGFKGGGDHDAMRHNYQNYQLTELDAKAFDFNKYGKDKEISADENVYEEIFKKGGHVPNSNDYQSMVDVVAVLTTALPITSKEKKDETDMIHLRKQMINMLLGCFHVIPAKKDLVSTTTRISTIEVISDRILTSSIFMSNIGDITEFINALEDKCKKFIKNYPDYNDNVKENYVVFIQKMNQLKRERLIGNPYALASDDKSQFQMQQQQQQQQQVQHNLQYQEQKAKDIKPTSAFVDNKDSDFIKWFGENKTQVTKTALDELKKYPHLAGLGIQLSNLPLGFYHAKHDGQEFIDYNPAVRDLKYVTPLTLRLFEYKQEDPPINHHLRGTLKQFDSKLPDIKLDDYVQQQMESKIEPIKIVYDLLALEDKVQENTIKEHYDGVLRELLKSNPEKTLKSLAGLTFEHGAAGVNLLLSALNKLHKDDHLKTFKQLFLEPYSDCNQFMKMDFMQSLYGIADFSKAQFNWWNALLKQHAASTQFARLPDLYNAFKYFCEQYKIITGKALPEDCPLKGVHNIPIALDRVLNALILEPTKDLATILIDVNHQMLIPPEAKQRKDVREVKEGKGEDKKEEAKPYTVKEVHPIDADLKTQFDDSMARSVTVGIKNLLDKDNKVATLQPAGQNSLFSTFQYVNRLGLQGDAKTGVPKAIKEMTNDELKQMSGQCKITFKDLASRQKTLKEKIERKEGDQPSNELEYKRLTQQIIKEQLKFLAVAREALYRSDPKDRYPNSTQILTVINEIIFNSKNSFAQIETGQGKSLTTALMASMLWLEGSAVDICTSDAHLAREGLKEFAGFYDFLKIPHASDILTTRSNPDDYKKDGINYSDVYNLTEFRSKMLVSQGKEFYHGHKISAILDEADYIVDLQTTIRYTAPLATPESKGENAFADVYFILNNFIDEHPDLFQLKGYSAKQTILSAAKQYVKENIADKKESPLHDLLKDDKEVEANRQFDKWLRAALLAKKMAEGEESGKIIVREVTKPGGVKVTEAHHVIDNRESLDARLKNGGQQFLHARLQNKYINKIKTQQMAPFLIEPEESAVIATVSKTFIDFYKKQDGRLKGTTGTLGDQDDRIELRNKFNVKLTGYPTHQVKQRFDRAMILKDRNEANQEIIKQIKRCFRHQDKAQPILIICKDAAEAKQLHDLVFAALQTPSLQTRRHLRLYTAKDNLQDNIADRADENTVITDAGLFDHITITDESLARGKDFKPDHPDGLFVMVNHLGTEKGVEQSLGRSGRQGYIGESLHLVTNEELGVFTELSRARKQFAEPGRKSRKFNERYAEIDSYFTNQFLEIKGDKTEILKKYVAFREEMESTWNDILSEHRSSYSPSELNHCTRLLIHEACQSWGMIVGSPLPDESTIIQQFISETSSVYVEEEQVIDLGDFATDVLPTFEKEFESALAQESKDWPHKANNRWIDATAALGHDMKSADYQLLDRYLNQLRDLHLNTKTQLVTVDGQKIRVIDENSEHFTKLKSLDYFAFAIDGARGVLDMIEKSELKEGDKLSERIKVTSALKQLYARLSILPPDDIAKAKEHFNAFYLELASLLKLNKICADKSTALIDFQNNSLAMWVSSRQNEHFVTLPEKKPKDLFSSADPSKYSELVKSHFGQLYHTEFFVKPSGLLSKKDFPVERNPMHYFLHGDAKSKTQLQSLIESPYSDPLSNIKRLLLHYIKNYRKDQKKVADTLSRWIDKFPADLHEANPILKTVQTGLKHSSEKSIDAAYCAIVDTVQQLNKTLQQDYFAKLDAEYSFSENKVFDKQIKYHEAVLRQLMKNIAELPASLSDSELAAQVFSKLEDIHLLYDPEYPDQKFMNLLDRLSLIKEGNIQNQAIAAIQDYLAAIKESKNVLSGIASFSLSSTRQTTFDKLLTSTANIFSRFKAPDYKRYVESSETKVNDYTAVSRLVDDYKSIQDKVVAIAPDHVHKVTKNSKAEGAVYVDKTSDRGFEICTLKHDDDFAKCLALAYIQIQQFMSEMKSKGDHNPTIYIRETDDALMRDAYCTIAAANFLKYEDENTVKGVIHLEELPEIYCNLNNDNTLKDIRVFEMRVINDLQLANTDMSSDARKKCQARLEGYSKQMDSLLKNFTDDKGQLVSKFFNTTKQKVGAKIQELKETPRPTRVSQQ